MTRRRVKIPLALAVLLAGLAAGLLGMRAPGAEPPAPQQITMAPGQTLEQLAEKYLGEAAAADEIRALNGIAAGSQPEPGTRLRLPGPERQQLLTMLRVAAQGLARARAAGAAELVADKFAQAEKTLERARLALHRAEYQNCRRWADEAFALANMARAESLKRQPNKNRFSVAVDKDGTTRVAVKQGDGVKVTAGKKSTTVKPGQATLVAPGAVPEEPHRLLPPPRPSLPNPGSRLVTQAIYFRWQPVNGAQRYVLLIARDRHGRQPVRQLTTDKPQYLFRSTLPAATYWWMVRSVDSVGLVGPASRPRSFILQHDNESKRPLQLQAPEPGGEKGKQP